MYCARERKKGGQRRRSISVFGVLVLMLGVWSLSYETLFFGHCILVIYIEEVFVGFFPLEFPRVKCCVPCDCVSLSDPLYVVIVKMY